MVDMYDKVVSTKLTDKEHNSLLELCNKIGCTPSKIIRNTILEKIENEMKKEDTGLNEKMSELNIDEINEVLGLKNKGKKVIFKTSPCIFKKCNGF